jgi:hypothetical protein
MLEAKKPQQYYILAWKEGIEMPFYTKQVHTTVPQSQTSVSCKKLHP